MTAVANLDEPDDVDRLFAKLEPIAAPMDTLERALAGLDARMARRRRRILAGATAGSAVVLLALSALSFALGRAIVGYGAGAVIGLVLADPRALTVAPADVLLAVAEQLPWGLVAAVACAGIILARCVRIVAATLTAPGEDVLRTEAQHG
jgi:hypothetical protein